MVLLSLLWIPWWSSHADDLSRLFTDSKQRQQLNFMRERGQLSAPLAEGLSVNQSANQSSGQSRSLIEIKGFVQRENGNNVVWVNDTNTLKLPHSSISGVKIDARKIVNNTVTVTLSGKKLQLKPGQLLDSQHGLVIEKYKIGRHEQQ